MDYIEKIERAIQYMEQNLTQPITVQDVSEQIFSSKWHFQRIFRSMTGSSLYAYIRRRRLSEAARELLTTRHKVIDVAFKYQYETPESFLREFKREYGTVPSDYRRLNQHLHFDRINMASDTRRPYYESHGITWQKVVRKEMHFVGTRYRTTMQQERSYTDIPAFWAEATTNNRFELIPSPLQRGAANGIYTGWDLEENFYFLVGAFTQPGATPPEGYVSHTLPAGDYMQFTVSGNTTERIVAGWKYIYGRWFAETGYEHGDADDFDHFDERFHGPGGPVSEIYISIK